MKAVVAAFNQEKALVGAFSVITNLRMELFEALYNSQYKIHPKQSSRSLEQLQLTSSPWHDHEQNRGTSYILYLPFRGNVQLLQTSVTNVTAVFRIPLVCVHRSFCCQRNNIAWPSPQSLPWNKWDTGTARARLDCSGVTMCNGFITFSNFLVMNMCC